MLTAYSGEGKEIVDVEKDNIVVYALVQDAHDFIEKDSRVTAPLVQRLDHEPFNDNDNGAAMN